MYVAVCCQINFGICKEIGSEGKPGIKALKVPMDDIIIPDRIFKMTFFLPALLPWILSSRPLTFVNLSTSNFFICHYYIYI